MKSLGVVALVLCASSLAVAGDPEFKGIVHSIEHTYGVHHMRIPLLGVAMFFARPSGVRGLKLAIFEGFQTPTDSEDVSRVIESSLGPGWYPFVRVRTKGKTDGETTLIYTSPSGNKMRMMIVSLEPSEAVVVKMELTEHAIEKWLKEPEEEVDHRVDGRHHEDKEPMESVERVVPGCVGADAFARPATLAPIDARPYRNHCHAEPPRPDRPPLMCRNSGELCEAAE